MDGAPDPDTPHHVAWDGSCLYDVETRDCVSQDLIWPAKWPNPDAWNGVKIEAMYQYCKENGKKWIWSIGGASDLELGVKEEQYDNFIGQIVTMLHKAGDGIDLDFEHLSVDDDDGKLRKNFAHLLKKLREGLDKEGLKEKTIGYTARYNAAWDDDTSPDGWTNWNTDGEALTINKELKEKYDGATLASLVDYAQIMFYDQSPDDLDAPSGLKLKNFKTILDAWGKLFPKEKIIMGFEPGPQFNNGQWEGADVDHSVIDYMKSNGYGGIFFWAINQPKVGVNAVQLADYAKNN